MAVKEPMDSVGREGRKVRLPRFELPKFDCDVTFCDQFEVSVHQQVDLSNATKLAYLRGCLTGAALDALRGLSAANQGYELGVQRLKERFDRPQGVLPDDSGNGGLSAAEVMITTARERLPKLVRIQWDKLTMEDGSLVADLTVFLRFLQEQIELSNTNERSEIGREAVDRCIAEAEKFCFCQKQHTLAECARLRQASRQKQREIATRYRLCFFCFKPGHLSSTCKSNRRRKSPSPRDNNSVVPIDAATSERVQEIPMAEYKSFAVLVMHANLASEKLRKINHFQRIKTIAYGAVGPGMTVTYLLDTGAEYSFVREDAASALGVFRETQLVMVEGFGGATHEHPSSQALTVPSLCYRIPESKILTSEWEHLQFLDPILDDESSDEVHVVIGIDYYYRFLGDAIRRGKPGDPVAVETVLGWIICGPVNPHPPPETVAAFNAVVEPKVEDLLRRFWEIEEMGVPFRSESDEVDPKKRFREGLSYDGTRYSVRLLWKNSGCWLPDNFAVAKRRLETTSRMVWLRRSRRKDPRDGRGTFLITTKERTSLNEQLDPGPNLQADLLGILLRFRRFRVALQLDIVKMFLQVGLCEEDRDVCRFLWRKDGPGGPLATYRLTWVCFGLACSLYLAMQVVNHHLISCYTIAEAKDLVRRSSELLGNGGFLLAKWASSAPEALVDRPTEEILRNKHNRMGKTLDLLEPAAG
ncbi:hypothetical protein T03_10585 [Trichinella britovi]|uniref:Peptidase A2 domain-containing protein n=1 Tax=Trichinella britovi TaxID=45882 RepID=A0A0V1CVL1_TRIBR|nr:hypothetical protein T03_10585 [Trichinella britovi]